MSRLRRDGVEELPAHLEASYGIEVEGIEQLDLGAYRVDRRDGPSWVARLFPAERSVVPRTGRREAIRRADGLAALGRLLGRLHTLPEDKATARPGGAWHHLADGAPRKEIAALGRLLDDTERPSDPNGAGHYDLLGETVRLLDDGAGLPEAVVHPDFVLANVVAPPGGGMVVIDWTGTGRAARVWSLAFLLWSVGFGGDLARVDRAVAGYHGCLSLEPEELERLEPLVRTRPIVFDAWAFCTGRRTLAQATAGIAATRQAAAAFAARAG